MHNLHPSSPERKHQLTMEKRSQIECLYNQNLRRPKKERLSLRRLAAKLGIARSTLSDEIRRGLNPVPNTFKDKDIHDYSASRAQAVVDAGALNKGVPQRYTNHIAAMLKELIVKDRLLPNHARSVLVAQGCHPWVPSTSCIYQHINAGDGGHGGLLVLIDRCTRFYIIRRLRHLTPDAVLQALRDIVRRKEIRVLKTITTDNGSEFLADAAIAAILADLSRELKLYYTHAYASWEKGSVENANALVRRWYPKGTDFSRVSHHAIRVLQEVINSIPRRVLDNRTAAQANAAAA